MKMIFAIYCFLLCFMVKAQTAIYTVSENIITFNNHSAKLPNKAKIVLDRLVVQLTSHPDYQLKIYVFCTKGQVDYCWDRVNTIVQYLTATNKVDTSRYKVDWNAKENFNTVKLNVVSYKSNTAFVPAE